MSAKRGANCGDPEKGDEFEFKLGFAGEDACDDCKEMPVVGQENGADPFSELGQLALPQGCDSVQPDWVFWLEIEAMRVERNLGSMSDQIVASDARITQLEVQMDEISRQKDEISRQLDDTNQALLDLPPIG